MLSRGTRVLHNGIRVGRSIWLGCELVVILFVRHVCNKKEIEFLELKQRKITLAKYADKFEEQVIFCPHYNGMAIEV